MELKILKFDHFGNGIGKKNDQVVFVKRALPSEIVDVEINNSKRKYMFGNIKKMVHPSEKRINSICPYYEECGGCNFLHVKHDVEIEFKRNKALNILNLNTSFYDTQEFYYRNKVVLHCDGKHLGFYKEKTNEIIDIDYCYLVDKSINNVVKDLKKYIKENPSNIEEVLIRVGDGVLLKIKGSIDDSFIKSIPMADTIIVNDVIVKGNGFIVKKLLGYEFKISPNSFFQVNYEGLECIYNILNENIHHKYKKCLDLYSGTSVMGMLISNFCDKVISIECNSSATNDAIINIRKNNIYNIEVINEKAEDAIDRLNGIDLIIVDPPRSGLDKKTISCIKKISSSKFIYISCDMITLKRDLKDLCEIYEIEKIELVNMFPKTYHVESVCFLKHK